LSRDELAEWYAAIDKKFERRKARAERSPAYAAYEDAKFKEQYGFTPAEMRERDKKRKREEDEREGDVSAHAPGNRQTHSGEHVPFLKRLFTRGGTRVRKHRKTRRR
jgi:hypothetical protein